MGVYFSGRILLCLAGVAALHAAPVTITGRVLDENGAPVRDARVTAFSGTSQTRATSDATGVFRLEIQDPGTFRVTAECDGYFLFSQTSVELSETAPLEIRLNHLKDLAESVDVNYSPPVIDPQPTSDVNG